MDVQMPIIDGYRATHLMRHHSPYNQLARHIPIVAMTASAIQGDREKCKKAGMDDYLAKPVKGKTLEKMLVRWAINRRVDGANGEDSHEGSECSEPGDSNCRTKPIPIPGQRVLDIPALPEKSSLATPRPTMNEPQDSHPLILPGTESEADRVESREEAEEKATALRDDKLVEAAGANGERPTLEEFGSPSQKLTEENVGKLDREAKARGPRSEFKRRNLSPTGDSMGAECGTDERTTPSQDRSGERPKMERRWRDSEKTVTGH